MDAPAKNGACESSYSSVGPGRLTTPRRTGQEDERRKKEVIGAVCWVSQKDEAGAGIAM